MLHKFFKHLISTYRFVIRFLTNKRAEVTIPDHVLTELARCFIKDIRAFFADADNQAKFERWLQMREQPNTTPDVNHK